MTEQLSTNGGEPQQHVQPPVRRNGDDEEVDYSPRRLFNQQNGGGWRDGGPRAPSHSWVASLTIIAVVLAALVSSAAIFKLFIEPLERRLDDHADTAIQRLDDHAEIALERHGGHVKIAADHRKQMSRDRERLERDGAKLEAEILEETRALWLAAARRSETKELARRLAIVEAHHASRFNGERGP